MKAVIPSDNNYEITNIKELIDFIQTTNTNEYYGQDNLTQPYAYMYPSTAPFNSIKIKYDDIIDCKKTESLLKPHCARFSPRKYDLISRQSISCTYGLKQELNKLKKPGQSYEMVIWDLILEHYDVLE